MNSVCMNVVRKVSVFFIMFSILSFNAWAQQPDENHMPLKFINKVEVFAGPSLNFNYGNKFIENYKDENIENKRLLKVGYAVGIGLYHTITRRVEINARFQFEKKGTNAELEHPFSTVNKDERQSITSDYSYSYLNFSLAPIFYVDDKKKLGLSIGGYFGKILKARGVITYYDLNSGSAVNDFTGRLWQSFNSDGTINGSTFIPGLQAYEENDYGIVVGAHFRIPVGVMQSLTLSVVDQYGMKNINNNLFPENLPERNHSLYFIVGYTFNRKAKL